MTMEWRDGDSTGSEVGALLLLLRLYQSGHQQQCPAQGFFLFTALLGLLWGCGAAEGSPCVIVAATAERLLWFSK